MFRLGSVRGGHKSQIEGRVSSSLWSLHITLCFLRAMHTLQNSNIACIEVISLFAIPLANFFADDLIMGTDSKSFIRLSPRFEYTY
jgi:hypothetical protein